MPLYERKAGKDERAERVRTVPESLTDERLRQSESWQLVDESKPKAKSKSAGGDERTGTGTAQVNVGQSGGA